MRTVKCDRCGKYFDYKGKGQAEKCVNGTALVHRDCKGLYYALYDLCPECVQKLKDFIDIEQAGARETERVKKEGTK